MAAIQTHPAPEYELAQPHVAGKVPLQLPARMIICAPSGSGKTVLRVSLLLDIFRRTEGGSSCFERIFIFSPTIHLDRQWDAVKNVPEPGDEGPQGGGRPALL